MVVTMRYWLNFGVMVVVAFGLLSVADWDMRYTVAAALLGLGCAALFDAIWGD